MAQQNEHAVSPASITKRIQGSLWQPASPPGPGDILVRVQACAGMGAAGTVIAAGDGVSRFAVGDQVFGHFSADSWAWVHAPRARAIADGPHVEARPIGLDPLAAAALADGGLIAETILRAADVQPGQSALVIGATSRVGRVLVPRLAEAGAHVIAAVAPDADVRSLGADDTVEYTTAYPVADALASHPDVDLLVDLVTFAEPYFIAAAAFHGVMVSAIPRAEPGVPRIAISAEPGDLAALAARALGGRPPVEIAPRLQALERRAA